MSAWTQREISRFTFRVALFIRRGLSHEAAEQLGEKLVQRDQDRDDRRMCLECAHLQARGTCFAAQRGWLPATSARHEPVRDLLQRCERFEFVTP